MHSPKIAALAGVVLLSSGVLIGTASALPLNGLAQAAVVPPPAFRTCSGCADLTAVGGAQAAIGGPHIGITGHRGPGVLGVGGRRWW